MAREKLGRVERGQVAVVAYRLTREDDDVVEERTVDEPLVYLHGHGQIAPALESAFADREVGATFEAVLPPEGWVQPTAATGLRVLPRDAVPRSIDPTPGTELTLEEDGDALSVWVTDAGRHRLEVSLTPPWGDEQLSLRGEVLEVRAPTAAELADGEALLIDAAARAVSSSESE